MKLLVLFFLISWGFTVFCSQAAQPSFTIHRRSDGRLLAEASSCEEIGLQAKNFEAWTHFPAKGRCYKTVSKGKNHSCSADFTECVPAVARKVLDRTSQFDGPNCLGLALAMSGLSPDVNAGTGEEVSFFLTSPLCRSVSSEERMPGDMVILEKPNEIYHAYIYVSPEACFSKNGAERKGYYHFQSEREILDTYTNPYLGECESCRGKETSYGCSACMAPVKFRAFRCSTFEEYLAGLKNKNLISGKAFDPLIHSEASIECSISSVVFGTSPAGPRQIQNIKDGVLAVLKWYDQASIDACEEGPETQKACSTAFSVMRLRLDRLQRTLLELETSMKFPEDAEFYKKIREYVGAANAERAIYFKKFGP